MKKVVLLTCSFIVIFTAGCGPPSEMLAVTMVAQTDVASTLIAGGIPTNTPKPTDTPSPTDTPTLPSPTETPAQILISDDFSSNSGIWGDCGQCEWKSGELYFGPYPVKENQGADQFFYVVCEACGENAFYRASADVTYFDGYGADRTFGILAGLVGDEEFIGAGTVTTNKHALYETFDFSTREWGGSPFKKYDAVRPGSNTNHIEVSITPNISNNTADITVSVNG